jgi:hypothetical protein
MSKLIGIIPDFTYLSNLPEAKSAKQDVGQPGKPMQIASAWVGQAVANESIFPNNTNSNNYVVGVNGRGSLQISPSDFDELLSVMLAVARIRAGFPPTEKD